MSTDSIRPSDNGQPGLRLVGASRSVPPVSRATPASRAEGVRDRVELSLAGQARAVDAAAAPGKPAKPSIAKPVEQIEPKSSGVPVASAAVESLVAAKVDADPFAGERAAASNAASNRVPNARGTVAVSAYAGGAAPALSLVRPGLDTYA
ncbi:MAG: hypothetical protein AAF108_01185 [Planctomycetota bacterium]